MYQGLLGTFPFTVTELEVSTFRDLKFSREQVYAEHRVLAGIPCLQHMGRNLDPVSLTVQIVPLTPVSTVVSAFRRPYGNPIVVQLLTDLKIALGFLLLIVPGIYWEYCYELVPYLLAENPYMSATRAMELSKEMMEGEKWNFFILKLSFFGWLLLCVFTFGIGGFFLEPYMQATYAEFYAAMRSKALAMGMTTTDELGGFVRHDTYPNDMDF